ncbi:hypothetical protein [Legionella gresilensis]|uniref:hypothetical protein n=1 Tax=Legionella gresilensis TaxID=91823 RepID=UPI0010415B44|nr:hypothetical protein [Legionella gresilensis]
MKNLFFLIFFFPSFLYANQFNFFIAGGITAAKLSTNDLVEINSDVINKYQTKNKYQSHGFWGGGFNQTFTNSSHDTALSLGIASYSLALGKIWGIEYPFFNEGLFDTLNYHFHVKNKLLLIESRLAYTALVNWQPFAVVGIGKSWNHFYHYREYPTNPALSAATSTPFTNKTQQDFSYELGLGLTYSLFNDKSHHINYFTSLSYRYFNLGKGKLAQQLSSSSLQIKNLSTQSIAVELNVSFTES